MKYDRHVNLLWISDIHFYKGYSEGSLGRELQNYVRKLLTQVSTQHTEECPIDYVLLSGDLAMKGMKADYESLFKIMLQPLMDFFLHSKENNKIEIPKILTIPGNHDVNWGSTNFLRNYLTALDNSKGGTPDRNVYLKDNESEFINLFKDYSDFIYELSSDTKYSLYHNFFLLKNDDAILVYETYNEKRLFGYVIDKSRRLIFMLLNSAWYSIGENFNELLASFRLFAEDLPMTLKSYADWTQDSSNEDEYKMLKNYFEGLTNDKTKEKFKGKKVDDIIPDKTKLTYDFIKEGFRLKDLISEYNKQIAGLNLFATEKFRPLLDMYNDYVIITCMHHPLNWLDWNEQYQERATNTSPHNLELILSRSDLFLTGHEHVPCKHSISGQKHNYRHLKGGCFLNDNQKDKLKAKNNWFSFLKVDTRKRVLKFAISEYVGENDLGNFLSNEEHEVFIEKLLPRKFILLAERQKNIEQLAVNTDLGKLNHYIKYANFLPSIDEKLRVKKSNKKILICIQKHKEITNIFIFAKSNTFYEDIRQLEFFKMLDSIVEESFETKVFIRFIVLDLFVSKVLTSKYEDKDYGRDLVRDIIFKRADLLFDEFRSTFFMRFEPEDGKVNKVGIRKYKNIHFINHLIPYWEFETIWS